MKKNLLLSYIEKDPESTVMFYPDELKKLNLYKLAVDASAKRVKERRNAHKQAFIKAFKSGSAEEVADILFG